MGAILNFVSVTVLTIYIFFGLKSLVLTYNDIRPSQERCELAFARQVRASPCDILNGIETVGVSGAQFVGVENLANVFVICFCIGVLISSGASVMLYRKHVQSLKLRKSSDNLIPNSLSGKLVDFLEHMVRERYVQTFQTFAALASLVVWGVATSLSDDINRIPNLFDPSTTPEDAVTISLWYTCGSHRLIPLAADLLVQGCVVFTLVVWVMSPAKCQTSDYRLALVDLIQASTVIWALTSTVSWHWVRPYNLYLLSGSVRAVRIFDGVPDLARHYNLLGGDSPSYPGRYFNSSSAASRRLVAGQAALAVKIGFFVVAAALLLVALEGWPCEYQIVNSDACQCFPEFRFFVGTLYFVFTTMATVGFGDIVPKTTVGRLLVIGLIATALYLAPTWITQIKTQHKHYRTAKRSERNLNVQNTSIPSTGHLPRRLDDAIHEGDEDEEEIEEQTNNGAELTEQPNTVLGDSNGPKSELGALVGPDHNDTLVEDPATQQTAATKSPEDKNSGKFKALLSPLRSSRPRIKSPSPRNHTLARASFGSFGSFKFPSSQVVHHSDRDMELKEMVSAQVTPLDWATTLDTLTKQQAGLAQQQALLQYLLTSTLRVCESNAPSHKILSLVAVLNKLGGEMSVPR